MYIQRNIEARSCSHCCSGIAISITYCECVFVALGIQHALRMHGNVIFGLSGSNTRVETLIVATIYLQLIQNRYMFRSFTVLQCSHQHCVQRVASDVEVVGYL